MRRALAMLTLAAVLPPSGCGSRAVPPAEVVASPAPAGAPAGAPAAAPSSPAPDAPPAPPDALVALGRAALAEGRTVVEGRDGWRFLASELVSLGHLLPLTGENSPVEVIVDFRDQLARAGIALLVVPVPARALVHGNRLGPSLPDPGPRAHTPLAALLGALRERGVETIDLRAALFAARDAAAPPYCRSDSHWSGVGLELAADAVSRVIASDGFAAELARETFLSERREIEIEGDLLRGSPGADGLRETLPLTFVGRAAPLGLDPVAPSRGSPVLLLGDSHLLVFHAGQELHATGAGFPDALALRLGWPLDVLGVRGSGATPARVGLARRGPDGLRGKKRVVWVFAERELDPAGGAVWARVQVVP